jgi:Domain of unknown function (DUF4412)
MRKLDLTPLFSVKTFFLGSSALLFAAFLLLACSNNNAATAVPGSSSSSAADGVSGSGEDMYYEYTIASVGTSFKWNGSTKMYVSSGGGMRVEMDFMNRANKGKPGLMVIIGSKDKPDQTISLDEDTKTYTVNVNDRSSDDKSSNADDPFKTVSNVSKVGEEKILGFSCVHARVISTKSMGPLGKQTDTIDLWNSPDVPLAPFLRQYMDRDMAKSWTSLMTPAAAAQLKQMGCIGFMVKMQSGSKNSAMHMELTKIQKGDFPKSMFEIPAGYKEEK